MDVCVNLFYTDGAKQLISYSILIFYYLYDIHFFENLVLIWNIIYLYSYCPSLYFLIKLTMMLLFNCLVYFYVYGDMKLFVIFETAFFLRNRVLSTFFSLDDNKTFQ